MRLAPLFSKPVIGILFIALTIASCKKDTDSVSKKRNPDFGNIAYFAKASGLGVKTATVKSNTTLESANVSWSSASVFVEKISFVGKNKELLDTTIIVGKNLNIFSADALMGVIKLPSGSYKNATVKMFCKKSEKSEMAFDFGGTFINTRGGIDSVRVGSSLPFEANLTITDIVINPSDNYKVTFNFDLNKVLTGITNSLLEKEGRSITNNNKKIYIIWKGGSADEPFYNQVIQNWQSVASIVITKENTPPDFNINL